MAQHDIPTDKGTRRDAVRPLLRPGESAIYSLDGDFDRPDQVFAHLAECFDFNGEEPEGEARIRLPGATWKVRIERVDDLSRA